MRAKTKRWLTVGVLGLVGMGLLGCQPARLRAPTYGSDVRVAGTRNFPDPSILAADGKYYGFSTNSSGGNAVNIGITSSSDLYNWTDPYTGSRTTGDALPTPPTWARKLSQGGGFWGPTVTRLGGRYVMHFAARHTSVSSSRPGWCIGTALSNSPQGPYTASNRPLFCRVTSRSGRSSGVTSGPATNQGSIDPQVFVVNGKVFLHFKALDHPTQLWGIQLRADGRAVSGRAAGMVALGSNARTWEYSPHQGFTILENPAMDYNPGARSIGYPYYLYYSGGDWQNASYSTGIAACKTPLGPCIRVTSQEPWLASRGSVAGPGGLSHFRVGNSRWVAYHSYERGAPRGNGRRLHVEPLGYSGLTAKLLSRRPTGSYTAELTAPGVVTVSGVARDADTGSGAPVIVSVREGTQPLKRTTTDANGRWSVTLTGVSPAKHKYCVLLGDENGLSPRVLRCQWVDASAGGAVLADESDPSASPPTTAPSESPSSTTSEPAPTSVAPTTVEPAPSTAEPAADG